MKSQLVGDKRLRDAVQALTPCGVAKASDDVVAELQSKHPGRSSPLPSFDKSACPPPLTLVSDDILKGIKHFPANTACGRDGLRANHLKQLVQPHINRDQLVEALSKFVNFVMAGNLPCDMAKFIASAPLTAIAKKDGGIRPIAVGEIYRRLVSRIANQKVLPQLATYLSPLQVGVGTRGGTEQAYFRFQDTLHKHGSTMGKVALFFDFKNAFNLCSRSKMFEEVRKHCPGISAWVEFCYRDEPYLFFADNLLSNPTRGYAGAFVVFSHPSSLCS